MRLMVESHDTDGEKNVHRFFEIARVVKDYHGFVAVNK